MNQQFSYIIDFNSIQYIDITMLAYSQDNMIKD